MLRFEFDDKLADTLTKLKVKLKLKDQATVLQHALVILNRLDDVSRGFFFEMELADGRKFVVERIV